MSRVSPLNLPFQIFFRYTVFIYVYVYLDLLNIELFTKQACRDKLFFLILSNSMLYVYLYILSLQFVISRCILFIYELLDVYDEPHTLLLLREL